MSTKKTKKPWVKENGKPLDDKELEVNCNQWSPEIWEDYLSTFEKKQDELLFDNPINAEEYSQDYHNQFYKNIFTEKDLPQLKKITSALMRELSDKQQLILYSIFWKEQKLSEIAEYLNLHKSSVLKIRDRALKQLAKKLVSHVAQAFTETQSNKGQTPDAIVAPGNKGNKFTISREVNFENNI
ncbi:MAG: sigma-70 family RNA polymerase sigma factor [Bdellovibrionaceae bacterium]|jgi:DNA-directed RNA polymerase specialized sigma subunit|nr:sigma-70 family RNA polymerase sigma factor [Pseudobdellovibrionaceae bacterium]